MKNSLNQGIRTALNPHFLVKIGTLRPEKTGVILHKCLGYSLLLWRIHKGQRSKESSLPLMAAIPASVVFFIFRFITTQKSPADCPELAEEQTARDAFRDADAAMLIDYPG